MVAGRCWLLLRFVRRARCLLFVVACVLVCVLGVCLVVVLCSLTVIGRCVLLVVACCVLRRLCLFACCLLWAGSCPLFL